MPLRLNTTNNCGGLVASTVASGDTSISVSLSSGSSSLPTAPFRAVLFSANVLAPILSKYEVIEVGSVTGSASPYTLGSLKRGQEGTTAQSWSVGDNVIVALTSGAVSDIASALPVNVMDYGAVADGSTDNTTAFNNALTARGSTGTILVPPGDYNFSGAVPSISSTIDVRDSGATLYSAGVPQHRCTYYHPQGQPYNLLTETFASGSSTTTTGSITLGQKALIVASATGWSVGMGISVAGAGASGALLVSQVVAISGTTFTLKDAAGTTVSGATVYHDDTEAIQAAVNALPATGGAVDLGPGVFNVSSTIKTGNGVDAGASSTILSVRLRGVGADGGTSAAPNWTSGTQLKWIGANGGGPVLLWTQGCNGGGGEDFSVNGNYLAENLIEIHDCKQQEWGTLVTHAQNGIGLLLLGTSTGCCGNVFRGRIFQTLDVNGSEGIKLDGTGGDACMNTFVAVQQSGNGPTGNGVHLGFADFNTFLYLVETWGQAGPNGVLFTGQAGANASFPKDNLFLKTDLGGAPITSDTTNSSPRNNRFMAHSGPTMPIAAGVCGWWQDGGTDRMWPFGDGSPFGATPAGVVAYAKKANVAAVAQQHLISLTVDADGMFAVGGYAKIATANQKVVFEVTWTDPDGTGRQAFFAPASVSGTDVAVPPPWNGNNVVPTAWWAMNELTVVAKAGTTVDVYFTDPGASGAATDAVSAHIAGKG